MADVRALIAACWADGSVEAAEWAVAVATAAQDAVAHHVAVICGEVNLALLHPMRFLAQQGHGRIHRFPITRTSCHQCRDLTLHTSELLCTTVHPAKTSGWEWTS